MVPLRGRLPLRTQLRATVPPLGWMPPSRRASPRGTVSPGMKVSPRGAVPLRGTSLSRATVPLLRRTPVRGPAPLPGAVSLREKVLPRGAGPPHGAIPCGARTAATLARSRPMAGTPCGCSPGSVSSCLRRSDWDRESRSPERASRRERRTSEPGPTASRPEPPEYGARARTRSRLERSPQGRGGRSAPGCGRGSPGRSTRSPPNSSGRRAPRPRRNAPLDLSVRLPSEARSSPIPVLRKKRSSVGTPGFACTSSLCQGSTPILDAVCTGAFAFSAFCRRPAGGR
jgi:hypothetical protein